MSDDPISPLVQEAITYRELFVALVAGGFTEDQALRLLAYRLAAYVTPETGNEGSGS